MALSTGMGAEVQRPLATVVIGGVIGAMSCRCWCCVSCTSRSTPRQRRGACADPLAGYRPERLEWLFGAEREEKFTTSNTKNTKNGGDSCG